MPLDSSPPIAASTDRRRSLLVYSALLLALFMAGLDNQIVITALPTIAADLGGIDRFAWITTAYLLSSSSTMPIYGKLGDLLGRKPVLLFAVALFLTGSAACGLAPSMNWLIAARFFQGLGAGGLMVSVFATIADLFPPRERAKYIALSGTVFLLANIAGPVLGGLFSQTIGWRWIFLVNMPIGVMVLCAVWLLMPRRPMNERKPIDVIGAVLLATLVASIVVVTDAAGRPGQWHSPEVLILVGVALICLPAWIAVERRAAEPIVPLTLFRDSTFTLCCVIAMTGGMTTLGIVNFIGLLLQVTLGASPTVAGLLFLPGTFAMVVTSNLIGRRMSKTGKYKWYPAVGIGFSTLTISVLLQLGPGSPLWLMLPTMMLFGIGLGLSQQILLAAVQNAVPKGQIGAATGALNLSRIAGAAIGLSAYGALFAARLEPALRAAGADIDSQSLTPTALAALAGPLRLAIETAYRQALSGVFLATFPLLLISFLAALALKPVRLGTRQLGE